MNENAVAQINLVVADYRANRTIRAASLGQGITGRFGMESEPSTVMLALLKTAGVLWVFAFIGLYMVLEIEVMFVRGFGGRPSPRWHTAIKAMLGSLGFILAMIAIAAVVSRFQ